MFKRPLLSISILALCVGVILAPHQATATTAPGTPAGATQPKIVVPWQTPVPAQVAAGCAVPSATTTGTTWYIDAEHGSGSGDGSAAHPWNSLNTILTQGYISTMPSYYDSTTKKEIKVMSDAPIHPGDIIVLESGNYGDILIQGAYGQTTYPIAGYDNSDFITIEAAPGATPVLSELHLAGGGKWIFRGLTIENTLPNLNSRSYGYLAALTGPHHDIIIDGNTLMSQPDTSGWTQADWIANAPGAILDYGGNYNGGQCITITNNKVQNVGGGNAIGSQRSENVLIKGNTINYFIHDGIDYASNNMVIQNNLLTNHIDAGDIGSIHPDFMQGQAWGCPVCDTLSNILIDSNIGIRQTDPNLPFATITKTGGIIQGIDTFDGQWNNITVTNNVIITSSSQGISYYGVQGAVIANNILMADGNPYGVTTPLIPQMVIENEKANEKANTPSSNVILRNNIVSGLGFAADTVNITVDHNLCVPTNGKCVWALMLNGQLTYVDQPGATYGDHNVVDQYGAPALFNNFTLVNGTVTALDLHLKGETPAVGTGNSVDAPTTDITGATRTTPMDLGAYMYAVGNSNPTDGLCGYATTTNYVIVPPSNLLCSDGEPSAVTQSDLAWNWSCAGAKGGATASCSAHVLLNGVCGSAAGISSITKPLPSANQCIAGTATAISDTTLVAATSTTPATIAWDWRCTGANGGASPLCTAPLIINGQCGTSNNASLTTIPTANLCSKGIAATVSGNGPWSWSCSGGSVGGSAVNCTTKATGAINGTCGASNGANLFSAPGSGLCNTGTASTVSGKGPWNWSCAGSSGGATASCAAQIEVNGSCGAANGVSAATPSVANLCASGSASAVTSTQAKSGTAPPTASLSSWAWSCAGSNGGSTATCAAPETVNGVCGTTNGTGVSAIPTTGLCSTGAASKVTGTGPWSWTCSAGSAAGAAASCSASKAYTGVVKILANARPNKDGSAPQVIIKVDGKIVGTATVSANDGLGQVGIYTFNFSQPTHPTTLDLTLNGYTASMQKYVSLNLFSVNFGLTGVYDKNITRTAAGTFDQTAGTVASGNISLSKTGAEFETNGSTLQFNVSQD